MMMGCSSCCRMVTNYINGFTCCMICDKVLYDNSQCGNPNYGGSSPTQVTSSSPSPSSSAPASMEAILARIAHLAARLEARLEATERRCSPVFTPSRAEANPPFGMPRDWRVPTWDPGSHPTTTPAATTLATSLPAVQHQPLPAFYDAARPPLGFRYPCSRSSAFIVSEPPAYSESYGDRGSSQYEYGVSRNHGGGGYSPYSHYGGGYSGGSYASEHNPYAPPPSPPRDGYYVPAPQPNPPSYTQPQQPDGCYVPVPQPNPPSYTPL